MKKRRFTNEFKLEAIGLVEKGGMPLAQVARDLGLHVNVLRSWVKLYGQRPNGTRMTPDEREELIRLRRDNRRLTEERDILKKAVSIFSKELR